MPLYAVLASDFLYISSCVSRRSSQLIKTMNYEGHKKGEMEILLFHSEVGMFWAENCLSLPVRYMHAVLQFTRRWT